MCFYNTSEATPIPDNEQTVIICEPSVSRISDGDELSLVFDGDNCAIKNGVKKVGSLKRAILQLTAIVRV